MKLQLTVVAIALAFALPTQAQTVSSSELKLSSHLGQTSTVGAWKYSTGTGVTVGVVDSGITASNSELQNKIVSAPNTNFIGGANNDVTDLNGHGTHVAGIIAARANNTGVVGAAPNAKVLSIRVATANGRVSFSALGQGIRRAAELVPIANISISGGACCINDIKYAVDRGLLLVVAAGNNGQAAPEWPARYAKETWAKGQIIAVGAVDQRNQITSWSNRAGDAQNFFLVAPGQWIASTKGNSLAYMSGTSMAAPQVAGAAALVKSRWNFLRADQIAEVLFRSATDLGAPGTDAVYGRGLLNTDRAMQPTGMTFVVNSKGQAVAANTVALAPAPAYSTALKNSQVRSVAVDELGRDFSFTWGSKVKTNDNQSLARTLAQDLNSAQQVLSTGTLAGSTALDDNTQVSLGALGSGLSFLQLHSDNHSASLAAQQLSNPVFSLVLDHSHIGYTKNLGRGIAVKAMALTTQGANQLNQRSSRQQQSQAVVAAAAYEFGLGSIGLAVSSVKEQSSLLGGTAAGLGFTGAPGLTFVTADAAFAVAKNTAAFVQITQAQSAASNTDAAGFSASIDRADAVKLGVVQNHIARKNDRLTMSIEQPLRVRSGQITVNAASGVDETGQLTFSKQKIDLAASGREMQLRIDYITPVKKNTHARAFVQLNNNPGHDASAKTESLFGVQLFLTF